MERVRPIIEALGGRNAVADRLDVLRENVDHWLRKDEFPGHVYFALCDLATEAGVELDPGLFHFERKPRTRKVRDGATTQDG